MTTSAAQRREAVWSERIAAWRASGVSASQFAYDHGVALSTLRYWSKRLVQPAKPRFVQLVAKPSAPPTSVSSELVVEVGAVRIRVRPGFDAALLSDVVRSLDGCGR